MHSSNRCLFNQVQDIVRYGNRQGNAATACFEAVPLAELIRILNRHSRGSSPPQATCGTALPSLAEVVKLQAQKKALRSLTRFQTGLPASMQIYSQGRGSLDILCHSASGEDETVHAWIIYESR